MSPIKITKRDVASKIISIIRLNLNLPKEDVSMVAHFNDYNVDPYEMTEALLEIEREFKVYFYEDNDLMRVKTFRDITDNVYRTMMR
jgi:acyl carrier protein